MLVYDVKLAEKDPPARIIDTCKLVACDEISLQRLKKGKELNKLFLLA